ncbi:MAG TPA: hypothetical protein VJN89_17400 [Candidatus Acidoferrum sp.]|nr:hypothetical protein [Candidatus Acidoferrum sp.]
MKAPWERHIWIAVVAGAAVSGVLFAFNFAMNPDHHPALSNVLFTAQYPGWIAAAFLLPGSFESANTANFIAIAVPVNAALYATLIFAALRLQARPRAM